MTRSFRALLIPRDVEESGEGLRDTTTIGRSILFPASVRIPRAPLRFYVANLPSISRFKYAAIAG